MSRGARTSLSIFPPLELATLEVDSMGDESEEIIRQRFWQECYGKIYAYLRRIAIHLLLTRGGSADDAEDMVSEGVIRAYDTVRLDVLAQLPSDRRLKVLSSYLFRAIQSAVHEHIERDKLVPTESLSDREVWYIPSYADDQASPSNLQNARRMAFLALLAKLPRLTPNDLEILTLRLGDGFSLPYIQWYMSNVKQRPIKKSTIYMRYNRAFKKLLTFLAQSPEFAPDFNRLKARLLEEASRIDL